ncbi:MAG: hypothetical protein ACJA0X_003206, partial [Cyclobacteriaceae bacterium]
SDVVLLPVFSSDCSSYEEIISIQRPIARAGFGRLEICK